MRLVNIWQLGLKELHSLFRDPVMLAFIVFAFTYAIYISATAMPEVINRAPIAIIDEDQSQLSRRISDAITLPYFTPTELSSASQIDSRMDNGLDIFSLNIPPNLQRDVLDGRQPSIQLNVDATRIVQAFTGPAYIQYIISTEVAAFVSGRREQIVRPIELSLRARFNPELKQLWFGGLMKLIDNITLLSVIITGAALLREREHGTVEHLLVMPVTPLEIMLSKVWAMGALVLGVATFSMIFVVQGVLSIPIEGSLPLFFAGTATHLFATTSLGILIATFSSSMPQLGMWMVMLLMPLQVLSGGTTPRESMPEFIQFIMLAAPNTHYVMLAQSILYRAAGFAVVWPQFAALAGIGTVFFSISLFRFRTTLGRMV